MDDLENKRKPLFWAKVTVAAIVVFAILIGGELLIFRDSDEDDSQTSTKSPSTSQSTAARQFNPQYEPTDFTADIVSPYFSLPLGKKTVYETTTEAGVERLEILIPGWTYTIDGVKALAYWNRLYLNGVLVEDTRDYLAQHRPTGDIWYFGEHVDNYENGALANHDGTWFAGQGTAKPGIWMVADPQPGQEFVHEFKSDQNYNLTKVVDLSRSVTVPAGTYHDCVKTFASAFPEGATSNYYFCKDIADIALEVDLKGPETPVDMRISLAELDPDGALGMTEVPEPYASEGLVSPTVHPGG
jgi:hypothetical protein